MLEVGVAFLMEEKGLSRKKATGLLFLAAWLLGCLCSLSFGPLSEVKLLGNTIFEFCDKLTSNFLMTFGGLLFTVFVGWKMKKSEVYDELTNGGTLRPNVRCFGVLYFIIRYLAPAVIGIIFVTNLLG